MSPPILLISCDELRCDLLDCYGGGGLVPTPHLDALAALSCVFDRAYTASPVCLPSRCALLSGRYPHRNGAYSNVRRRHLDPAQPNCYNLLQAAAYHTAHVGKCHYTATPYGEICGHRTLDREPVKDFYCSLGLDHLDLNNGKNNSVWFWNDYSRELEGAGLLAGYRRVVHEHQGRGKSFVFPGPRHWHPDWWCARKCVEHLESYADEKPFFCWLSFPGPHYPHDPPAEYLERVDAARLPLLRRKAGEFARPDRVQYGAYHGAALRRGRGCEGMGPSARGFKDLSDTEWRHIQHHYLANIALLDDAIGMVLAAARARFGEELIVLFTADHGDCMGAHGLWSKNACGYEEVLRVPLLVQGGGLPVGRQAARVSLIDILPSCCVWAGQETPPGIDGRSLQGSIVDGDQRILAASMEGQLIVHDERWKLIIDHSCDCVELYDRRNDPGEYVNLADEPAAASERSRLEAAAIATLMAASLA